MSTPLEPRGQAVLEKRTAITPIVRVAIRRGEQSVNVVPISGSVTLDARRSHRTTASLQLRITPDFPELEVVNPFGTEIDISVGVRLADDTEYVIPIGTALVVNGVSGPYTEGSVIQVDAIDFARRADRFRFAAPLTVPAGDLADVISAVLTNRGLPTTLPTTGVGLTASRVFGLEASIGPWEECISLAREFGWRLWIDRFREVILDQPPDPRQQQARKVLLLNPNLAMSDEPPSLMVARFEPNEGTPRVGIAEDDDPSSLTNIDGPYGPVTQYFGPVNLEVSQAGADQAAESLLEQNQWQGVSWAWTVPYDPTIDPDDLLSATPRKSLVNLAVDAVTTSFAAGQAQTVVEGKQPI